MFSGDPKKILINNQPQPLEVESSPAEVLAEEPKEKDPLASTDEEDLKEKIVPRNLTELDRLQFTVYAIENDCHIIPKGSFKLTD
jgi:radial spoke head protein 9